MPLNKEPKPNIKAIHVEEQKYYYLTHSWMNKDAHSFSNVVKNEWGSNLLI